MQVKERNNDQNIKRVHTKMSEGCSSQKNKPKLTDSPIEKLNNSHKISFNHSYEHLYANPNVNLHNYYANVHSQISNCQNCKSEVRFLEEWLLLHLDIIQQQSEEIVGKETTIYMLQGENEMLREHINCLQGAIAYSPPTPIKNFTCSMTQDAAHINDDKTMIYACGSQKPILNNGIKKCGNFNDLLSYSDSVLNHSQLQSSCDIDSEVANTSTNKSNMIRDSHSIMKQNKNDLDVSSFQDTLKNFEMSIKRKRLCSGSSAFSNSTSIDEPHTSRKRKKRTTIKEEAILTSNEQYVTQASESSTLGIPSDPEHSDMSSTNNLEVPRWRVRVYTSLYSMEGTENLDDDVFNKRHMRLENNERRRKRWDVQRIREQRVIEKLKLRQQRIAGDHMQDKSKLVSSFWPTLDDVKYIEVSDELPVSAFGAPVPRLTPSEFSIPWEINFVEPKVEVLEPEQPFPQVEQLPVKRNRVGRKPKKRRKVIKR